MTREHAMSRQTHRFPVFFQPLRPPPAIPVLLSQMELAPQPTTITLLCMQELSHTRRRGIGKCLDGEQDKDDRARRLARAGTPSKSALVDRSRASPPARAAPYDKHSTKRVSIRSATPLADDSSPNGSQDDPHVSEVSDGESEVESDDEDGLVVGLIPKPRGEAGRPSRGGYNLTKELGWDEEQMKELRVRIQYFCLMANVGLDLVCLQVFVEDLAKKHLDLKKSYTKQSEERLKIVRNEVRILECSMPSDTLI
jgi:hypothetical protein